MRQGIALVQGGLNAQLALLHVQEPATFLELATNDSDLIAGAALEAGKDLLASAEALAQAAGVPFTSEIALGEPATELLDLAESFNASMLIIGARGVGALPRALMGSVSQAIGMQPTLLWMGSLPYLINAFYWFVFYKVYPKDVSLQRERTRLIEEGKF